MKKNQIFYKFETYFGPLMMYFSAIYNLVIGFSQRQPTEIKIRFKTFKVPKISIKTS